MWIDLAAPWQACLEEAWVACLAGSMPIGAVVVDEHGKILSRGRNHRRDDLAEKGEICGNHLAHAEINALLKVADLDKATAHKSALYTTLQPCPLCFSAFYMSGLRELRYAARDAYGGSDDLLGKTPYLSLKPIHVVPPQDEELERMIAALFIADTLADINYQPGLVMEEERKILPIAVEFGEFLYKEKWLLRMAQSKLTPKAMYENLIFLSTNVFRS
jgi:tRNA(Arg) A34 adenosine deaminase TadA